MRWSVIKSCCCQRLILQCKVPILRIFLRQLQACYNQVLLLNPVGQKERYFLGLKCNFPRNNAELFFFPSSLFLFLV